MAELASASKEAVKTNRGPIGMKIRFFFIAEPAVVENRNVRNHHTEFQHTHDGTGADFDEERSQGIKANFVAFFPQLLP